MSDTPRESQRAKKMPEPKHTDPTAMSVDGGQALPRHAGDARAQSLRHPFTRSLLWTLVGTFFPGLGLWPTRRRATGLVILAIFASGIAVFVAKVFLDTSGFAAVAVQTTSLVWLAAGLVALAVLWVMVIAGTHLVTRPKRITGTQRLIGAATVAALSFVVAAPLAVGARYAMDQRSLVADTFSKQADTRSQTRPTLDSSAADMWVNKPRLNILLLGGDAGQDRTGLRTDTIMVASIDTATGDTTLIQIPRNMARVPFPQQSRLAAAYPQGFYDGNDPNDAEYFANSIWDNVPAQHPELFQNTDNPGADALKLGIGTATGLNIDYFVLLSIEGLQRMIDAMGGITINVNRRIPIAGNTEGKQPTDYLEAGPNRHLNGYYAMWYARSRSDSTDYARMARQSCVVKAVIEEANPETMLTRYEAIARAGKGMVMTDIPQEVLPGIVDVALKVKDANIRRVLFVHLVDGYDTTNPNYEMMRERVATALAEASAPPTSAQPSTTAAPPATASSKASSPSATPSTQSENVGDACAYRPE